MYHHTLGVWLCQEIFGRVLEIPRSNSEGTIQVPVRLVAEQHILEDLGWLPSPADYIEAMPIAVWMSGSRRKEVALSHILGKASDDTDAAAAA